MCAKGSTQATRMAADGEFLHQLEEKMEVRDLSVDITRILK
jgi:hypothetical protein